MMGWQVPCFGCLWRSIPASLPQPWGPLLLQKYRKRVCLGGSAHVAFPEEESDSAGAPQCELFPAASPSPYPGLEPCR